MYLILDQLFIHFSHQQELPLLLLKTYCACITAVCDINRIQTTRVPPVFCPFFLKKKKERKKNKHNAELQWKPPPAYQLLIFYTQSIVPYSARNFRYIIIALMNQGKRLLQIFNPPPDPLFSASKIKSPSKIESPPKTGWIFPQSQLPQMRKDIYDNFSRKKGHNSENK